ncbi:MAG: diaminopimelate decarboxylase, partial [Lachnospiraceae bacterium]
MKKIPFVTKAQAEAIAKDHPTPFYLYDERGIRKNAEDVKKAFSWNPGFCEYFAVKATPNPYLMQIMQDYGFGFDCSSKAELLLSDAVGAPGPKIMFSSNDTPAEEYALAKKLGAIINLDDITHIDFLASIIGDKFPKTMCCRYNPGGVFQLANGIMDNPGDSKYGMTKEQLFEAYARLKEHGVENFGLHAFLASNTVTNDYYPELAAQLFAVAKEAHEKLGIHFAFINLSGGVGCAYKPDQEPNDIFAIGEG